MSTIIPFPTKVRVERTREPSLREILISRGIEPTGEERRRKRRERAEQKKIDQACAAPQ
jgi:hypothetical protein